MTNYIVLNTYLLYNKYKLKEMLYNEYERNAKRNMAK